MMIDVVPHLPAMRRYALNLTRDADRAEDLVQFAVLRALEKQHLFQPGTSLAPWLISIVHNTHINQVRAIARRREMPGDPEAVLDILPARDETDARTHLREVGEALARLPPQWRRLLLRAALLSDSEQLYEALASYEGVPVGTVRSRLSRARAALRVLTRGAELRPGEKEML